MNTNIDKYEATALAEYEPVDSEFREHALMEWRTEEKGKDVVCMSCACNLYGLPWKYVRVEMEE